MFYGTSTRTRILWKINTVVLIRVRVEIIILSFALHMAQFQI